MADDTQLGLPSGVGDVISTDDLGTKKVQRVKVQHGADGSATDASTASPLPVDQTNATVADGGVLPAKGVQVGGTDGSVFQVLSTDNTGRANVNVNGTVPVSIAATQAVNEAQVGGTATDTNSGVKSAGTQRVVLATDQPQLTNALKTDGSATTQPVSGTVTSTLSATTNAGATAKTSDYDTGAGTDTVTSFGIALPASGGAVQGGTGTNPVRTDPTGTTTQPVSGTVTANLSSANVTNAGTFAVQDSEKLADNAAFTDGTTKVNPVGFIFDEVAGTALTENDIGAGRMDAKRAQVSTLEDATTRGQRAAVSAAGALKVDASATTQPVSGTVSITANSAVNVAQVAGTTTDTNSGVKSAGTQRMVLATDQPQLTNALKVDPSAVTSPVSLASLPALATGSNLVGRVNLEPETTGGLSIFHLVSAATTNATNVKASAGQVYGWYIYNSNAAARKVAFHNTAGTPTAGASVSYAIVIPPSSAANVEYTTGIAFATGIAITTVTDLTDAGATAVAASDLIINVFFK
jgi:hypothetical protein